MNTTLHHSDPAPFPGQKLSAPMTHGSCFPCRVNCSKTTSYVFAERLDRYGILNSDFPNAINTGELWWLVVSESEVSTPRPEILMLVEVEYDEGIAQQKIYSEMWGRGET